MADENSGAVPGYGWTATEEAISFYFVIFLSLLATVLVLGKLLHDRPWLSSCLPEAGMTIIVGVIAGYFVYLVAPANDAGADDDDNDADGEGGGDGTVADGLLSFSSTVFFVALLPPIIFNSGYHLKRELFFRHMKPIVLFACVGTAVSALVIAVLLQIVTSAGLTGSFRPHFTELLTFGALISATDPVSTLAVFQTKRVDPQLFYLVFGESVLNDAVGLVLFNAFQKFVGNGNSFETVTLAIVKFVLDFLFSFVGSLSLGVLSGILAALLLKKVDMRQTGLLELSLFVLVMYLPFFIADVLQLSGIVTILFTGIAAKRYAQPNLSPSTESEADVLFRVTAHLAETAIFLELGLSVFGLASYGNYHWRFILWAVLFCLVGRAANIYPIAIFFNRTLWRKDGRRLPLTADEGGAKTPSARLEQNDAMSTEGSLSSHATQNVASRTPYSRHDRKIGRNTAHMLWFSGLRGAVAYACAKTFPNSFGNRTPFVITTMVIVLVTVFLLGGTTEIALGALDIDTDVDEDEYIKNEIDRLNSGLLHRILQHEDKYICPFVIRDYGTSQSGEADTDQTTTVPHTSQTSMPISSEDLHLSYVDEVEMTQIEHLSMMRQMGYLSRGSWLRRKKSLYDYGSR